MKHFACIVGARPNFMKMAPLLRALEPIEEVQTTLIHTGQHYDKNLSDIFFAELGIKRPEISLGIGSGSHAQQTARILEAIEEVLQKGPHQNEPGKGPSFDRLVVVGDVNSTMAASLAAAKLNIPIAHVEAGLRSFDRTMPEEINRLVTDAISDMLLVSESSGVENLRKEHIHLVGNLMIDTLLTQVEKAQQQDILTRLEIEPSVYGLVTLHRPANVDTAEVLGSLVQVLVDISARLPIIFPVHPRTKNRLESFDLWKVLEQAEGIRLQAPLGYLDFLCLSSQAKVIVTDSGGLQEESTVMGVPCLTMRPNTERPVTVSQGTSTLVASDARLLADQLQQVLEGQYKQGVCPPLWDGHAAGRIVRVLMGK